MKSLATPLTYTMGGLILAALLCAAPMASATTCSAPPEIEAQLQAHSTVSGYLRLAHWFDGNHQADCAIQAFQAALKLDPGSKAALDGLAKDLIATRGYQAVIRLLRAVPRDQNLTLDLAAAYRKAQMFEEAAQVLREALRTYPNSVPLTGALVSLEAHQSHYAVAQTLAEDLAHRYPANLEAQRIYFRTLIVSGEEDAATPLGRKLLALAPKDEDILNLNGFLERKAGDYAEARKHLEAAVELNPGDYNPRVNLGLVLAQLKDAAGAKTQLEKALELGAESPQVHFELSKVLRSLGENEEAQRQLELFQQGLKTEANQSAAVLKATEAAEAAKNGDNQKAADLYREACALEPNDAGLAYRLSAMLGDLGDLPGQRAALEQALKADPNFVLAHYDLGYIWFQAGNNADAEEQFRLVVKAAPDNARAWVTLAAVLATESRLPEAQQAVANALKLEPGNAAAHDLSKKLASAQQQQPN
jgi:tetratricopeptide (TPR) repeat protein